MNRLLLTTDVHPAITATHHDFHADVVKEVEVALKANDFVIVGMAQNPFCKKARATATASNHPFAYLEYGSYLSAWKPRLAIKMWSGWPTFPQVFIKGRLIGGAQELQALADSGELSTLLAKAD